MQLISHDIVKRMPLLRNNFLKLIVVLLFLVLGVGFFWQTTTIRQTTTKPTEQARKDLVKVVKVIDGDTIDVFINGKTEPVRLIGINTPELDECFGQEAAQKAKEILSGKSVVLETDISQDERDKYNRLLKYVFLEDGTNFGRLMLSQGYGREYTYLGRKYKYQNEFKLAEKEARESRRGLWSSCNF